DAQTPARTDSETPKTDKAAAKGASDREQTSKKKKKKNRKADADGGNGDSSSEQTKGGKHPSVTLGQVKLNFKSRLENELRGPTPSMGLDGGQAEWQDRRIGVEGTAFTHFTFEVSHELSRDFEESHDLSEKTAWKDV